MGWGSNLEEMSGAGSKEPHRGAGHDLAGDGWGGLAAMLVALPSAIAFGVSTLSQAGPGLAAQGALMGILGAVLLGLVAPILGGTPRLISAPCAPAAMVLGGLAAELAARGNGTTADPAAILLLLALVTASAGALQLLFGILRGGQLIKYIPYPVVAGYLSGVGIKIILDQLPKLAGIGHGTSLGQGLTHPGPYLLPAACVSAASIAGMLLGPRLTRKVPAPIIALGAGVTAYWIATPAWPALATLAGNPLLIGPIEGGVSSFTAAFDRWSLLPRMDLGLVLHALATAGTLAVLLSIDTLKTCVILDTLTRSRHDSNKELRGQGLGNLASALCGGMAGAGTSGATLVNLASGARSRRSGLLAGVFSLLALLVLSPLIAWIPRPALAGILVIVGFRMVDRHSLTLLKQRSTHLDFAVILSVIILAVTAPLLVASGAGLGLAILLFLREQIRTNVIRRRRYADTAFSRRKYLPDDLEVLVAHGRETAVVELQGSLFFGTTDQLMSQLESEIKSCRRIILDMRRVSSVDFTATHMLAQMAAMLGERGGELVFADISRSDASGRNIEAYLEEAGLGRADAPYRTFGSLDEALEYVEDRVLEEEERLGKGHGAPLELADFDLLRGLDDEARAALAAIAEERELKEGTPIFRAGERGDEIFLVRKGTVKILLRLSDGRARHLASFARKDFFGDMAFIDAEPRSADAVAATRCWLYVLSRRACDQLTATRPGVGAALFRRLARALAHRLRQTDGQLRELEEG